MADPLDDVLHITNDPALAAALEASHVGGGSGCLLFPDVLAMGPLHTDPRKHRKKRLGWWREVLQATTSEEEARVELEALEEAPLSAEQLGSIIARHVRQGQRAVLWTSPAWSDRVTMWFVFHAALEAGVDPERLTTAEIRRRDDDDTRWLSVAEADDDDVDAAWGDLFHPVALYVETCAALWQTFATGSPRQLAISVPHTEKFFPALPEAFEDHGRLFPQVRASRPKGVRLSELDHGLLAALGTDAARPLDLAELPPELGGLDARYVLHRLSQWVAWNTDAPVLVVEGLDDGGDAAGLRLTERGARLVANGFEGRPGAPVLHAGDARMYAGKHPWVRVVDRQAWWFERHGDTPR